MIYKSHNRLYIKVYNMINTILYNIGKENKTRSRSSIIKKE